MRAIRNSRNLESELLFGRNDDLFRGSSHRYWNPIRAFTCYRFRITALAASHGSKVGRGIVFITVSVSSMQQIMPFVVGLVTWCKSCVVYEEEEDEKDRIFIAFIPGNMRHDAY